jgi:hypothetical protein
MVPVPWRIKDKALQVYPIGRSYLFDLLLRELNNNKVGILDGISGWRAYEQLLMLEMEYRQSGAIYGCASGRHDDLAISCAIVVWAAQHPHLPYWCRALEPPPPRTYEPLSPAGWT